MIDYENRTIEELEKLATKSNDAEAMLYLGVYYYQGESIGNDLVKAVDWFQKAAKLNHTSAMFNLALCYHKGEGIEQDVAKAFEWYKKAAEAYNVDAIFHVAECYRKGEGVKQDLIQAFYWYEKAAEAGDASAMFNLALCYDKGDGVSLNVVKAFEWYKKSAELRNANAMINLALCYDKGEGVKQDLIQAFYWYEKASQLEVAPAMNNLANLYRTGEAGEQDLKQAFYWYEKSATAGNPTGIYNLALCYENGVGIARNLKEAVKWYKQGVEALHPKAMFNLSLCYYQGRGVAQNIKKAAYYLLLAAKQGNEKALFILIKESDFRGDRVYPEAFNVYLEKYYPICSEFSKLVNEDMASLYKNFLQIIVETENKHLLNINENNVLYHYTSQKVLSILLNKFDATKPDDTKEKLRLSMATYLNDPTEGRYIFDRAFEANSDIGDFVDNVRNVFEPYMQDEECVVNEIRPQVYSLSFSTDSDCLDLWRAYGRDEQGRANGVNIAIPTETLEQFNAAISTGMGVKKFIHATSYEDSETQHEIPFLLYKVEYGKDKVIEMWKALQPSLTKLLKAVNNIKDKELTKKLYALIYDAMARLMYLYKHDAYQSEKEVRALHIGTLLDAKYDAIISRVYFETPALLFQHKNTEITLGPQMQPDERSVLLWALRKRMIDLKLADKVTIKSSKVPFR